MHVTSDGLELGEVVEIIKDRGITVVIRAEIDNYIELYTGGDRVGDKKRIGEAKPSKIYNGKFILSCDLPCKPSEEWEYKHSSYKRDFKPGELGLLL